MKGFVKPKHEPIGVLKEFEELGDGYFLLKDTDLVYHTDQLVLLQELDKKSLDVLFDPKDSHDIINTLVKNNTLESEEGCFNDDKVILTHIGCVIPEFNIRDMYISSPITEKLFERFLNAENYMCDVEYKNGQVLLNSLTDTAIYDFLEWFCENEEHAVNRTGEFMESTYIFSNKKEIHKHEDQILLKIEKKVEQRSMYDEYLRVILLR